MQFIEYYDAVVANAASYTPADAGLYYFHSDKASSSIRPQGYVNSGWQSTGYDSDNYFHPYFITTGSEVRILNSSGDDAYIVVTRIF